jgi:hypothetical protein
MSQRCRPFMVGASEEIGSQEVEDPWLLGRRPLTGSSLRLPLPMGGSHPVPAQLIGSHCRFARHAAATAAATGDPAIVVSVRRASRRERSHGREARFASGGPPETAELSRTPECAIVVRSCLMLRWLPYWRRGVRRWLASPAAGGETRHVLLRRPSACLGPLCDPTIVKCGRDFSAA